jgi:hypothetical protein
VCAFKKENILDEFYWQNSFLLHFKRDDSKESTLNILEMKSFPKKEKNYKHVIEVSLKSNLKINQTHLEMCEIFKSIARQLAIQW